MSLLKRISLVLIPLFVLFAANGSETLSAKSPAKQDLQVLSEDRAPDQSLSDSRGWYSLSVKGSESFYSAFQNCPTGKKYLSSALVWRSDSHIKSFFSFYSLSRVNSLSDIPIYIRYRRLTI